MNQLLSQYTHVYDKKTNCCIYCYATIATAAATATTITLVLLLFFFV